MSGDAMDEGALKGTKDSLRKLMRVRRKTLSGAAPESGLALASCAAAHDRMWTLLTAPGAVVAGYYPLPGEMDVLPLMEALAAAGVEMALPEVTGAGQPLRFRQWTPGAALERGPFATLHPGAEAPVVRPTVVVVPLLAFDRAGYRLGYGGGFYDRTLSGLRHPEGSLPHAGIGPTAIGAAFSGQMLAEVPRDVHDQRLDWILTEDAIFDCR